MRVQPKRELGLLVRVLFAAAVGVVLKLVQLVTCSNPSGGLLKNTAEGRWLSGGVVLMLVWIAAEFLIYVFRMKKETGYLPSVPTRRTGIAELLLGLVTGIESAAQLLACLQAQKLSVLGIAAALFGLGSAVVFLAAGLREGKEPAAAGRFSLIVPILWSALVLANVTFHYTTVIAMQLPLAKVLCCCLAVLFLLYQVRALCGFEADEGVFFSLFFRLASPCLLFVFALPYGTAFLCGIRDRVVDVPYFSFTVLAVYGLLAAIDLLFSRKTTAVEEASDA